MVATSRRLSPTPSPTPSRETPRRGLSVYPNGPRNRQNVLRAAPGIVRPVAPGGGGGTVSATRYGDAALRWFEQEGLNGQISPKLHACLISRKEFLTTLGPRVGELRSFNPQVELPKRQSGNWAV
jgi:hypothetical protein